MLKRLSILIAAICLNLAVLSLGFAAQSFQISGISFSSTPLVRGIPVTVNVNTDKEDLYYKFYIADKYGTEEYPGSWETLQEWSTSNTCDWIPREEGRFVLVVWVDEAPDNQDYEIVGSSLEVLGAGTITVNLGGTYEGTVVATQGGATYNLPTTLNLTQTGSTLGGTWSTDEGNYGTVSGTVLTNVLANFTLVQTIPCTGNFSGTMGITNNGDNLSGAYTGSDCEGHVVATFTFTRQ